MIKLIFQPPLLRALVWASLCLLPRFAWAHSAEEMSREAPDFSTKSPLEEDPENSLFSPHPLQKLASVVRAVDDPRKLDFVMGYSVGYPPLNRIYAYLLVPLPKTANTQHFRIGMGLGRFFGRTTDSIEFPFELCLNQTINLGFSPALLFNRVDGQLGTQGEAYASYSMIPYFNLTTGVGFRRIASDSSSALNGGYVTLGIQAVFSKLL